MRLNEFKISKLFSILVFSFIFLFLLTSFVSASYGEINFNPFQQSSFVGDPTDIGFDQSMCEGGQDFIIQIAPGGCSPAPVRSDLLEEQDVPIFCELQAIKVNPLIDIETIKSISFKGSDYPREVSNIGFYPSYSALGANRKLNNMMWDSIGYVVINLRQNANESSMSDWIEGNLSAQIKYDIREAFGIRDRVFYLPLMDNAEFDKTQGRYSFFDNRGYLRAEDIQGDSASIVVYSGRYNSLFGKSEEGDVVKEKLWKENLDKGELSSKVYLPGFDCFSAVQFRLDGIEAQDTRARIKVNSEIIEVKEDEYFLDQKCQVKGLDKRGLRQEVKIYCNGDEDKRIFPLSIDPSIKLKINGIEKKAYVGDYLYSGTDGTNVYLGYVGTEKQSGEAKDLKIYLVTLPGKIQSEGLNADQVETAALLDEYYSVEEGNLLDLGKVYSAAAVELYHFLLGKDFEFINMKKSENFKGKEVEILNFGDGENLVIKNKTLKDYYGKAVSNYEKVKNNFQREKYPGTSDVEKTLGEKSLKDLILLADQVYQKQDVKQYCDEFEKIYKDYSLEIKTICNGLTSYANRAVSTKEIWIEGDFKEISFQGIYEPDEKDYSTELTIRKDGEVREVILGKKDVIYLDTLFNKNAELKGDYIRLEEINDEKTADFYFSLSNKEGLKGALSEVKGFLYSNKNSLKKDVSETFGSEYVFTLNEVKLERVAKVSLHSSINKDETEANFGFKIAIEKRLIQLSPEKTRSRIESLESFINQWTSISNSLGTVVEGMKTACLVTGAALVVKNLVTGSGGAAIARQEIMRGEGGWYSECANLVEDDKYDSVDECLFDNAEKIDDEVDLLVEKMNDQNDRIKKIHDLTGVTEEGSIWEQDRINQNELIKHYSKDVRGGLDKGVIEDLEVNGEKIDFEVIEKKLNEEGFKEKIYGIEDLKEIELYSDLLKAEPGNKKYENRLFSALMQVENNAANTLNIEAAKKLAVENGLEGIGLSVHLKKDQQYSSYGGFEVSDKLSKKFKDISKGTPLQEILYEGNEYLVSLVKVEDVYRIENVYTMDGELIGDETEVEKQFKEKIIEAFPVFKKYDQSSYNNKIVKDDFKVRYYETDPYKGLPAVVPFDEDKGWYAYIKQTLPALGEIRTYDQSGRVNSFYLCNVGKNHLLEKFSSNGDDICQMINLGTGQSYNQFPGLGDSDAAILIKHAVDAIKEASKRDNGNTGSVQILGKTVQVGSPEFNVPSIECMDIMSPNECRILFNLCDPVICPKTRCDFGGEYPVRDVVQSGIIGSIALCLPNFPEVYVPVCLTGIKAGIDGLLSVTDSYRSCLQTSLDDGSTVGICDEINSIYMCEFFWRQALPLTQVILPKILGTVLGQGTRGGGEYLWVDSAWENAKDSVSYFTNFYAVNAFDAFKARSQEEVGTEVCKQSLSVAFPGFGGSLKSLTKADSPPQFTAKFDVIPFTTATEPPMDHYKVFYHIYAGKDQGAYFKVYLRGGGSSYYQDASFGRSVDSGYISAGEYKSETVDFTAPSGFKQLCVQVNNQEECGFGTVTTDFATNYLGDQYLISQSTGQDVRSEKECVSGTTNFFNIINPNIQEGIGDVVSSEIYNEGIIRICATDDPGLGTDEKRWVDVGYCDDEHLRCWIDKDSLDDVFKFDGSREEAVGDLDEKLMNDFIQKEGFLNDDKFAVKLIEIEDEKNLFEKLKMIDGIFDFVFENNKKAYFFFLNGGIYGELSVELFIKLGLGLKREPSGLHEKYKNSIIFVSQGGGLQIDETLSEKDSILYNELKLAEEDFKDLTGDYWDNKLIMSKYCKNEVSVNEYVFTDGQCNEFDGKWVPGTGKWGVESMDYIRDTLKRRMASLGFRVESSSGDLFFERIGFFANSKEENLMVLSYINSDLIEGDEFSFSFEGAKEGNLLIEDFNDDLFLLESTKKKGTYPTFSLGNSDSLQSGDFLNLFTYNKDRKTILLAGEMVEREEGMLVTDLDGLKEYNLGSPVLNKNFEVIGVVADFNREGKALLIPMSEYKKYFESSLDFEKSSEDEVPNLYGDKDLLPSGEYSPEGYFRYIGDVRMHFSYVKDKGWSWRNNFLEGTLGQGADKIEKYVWSDWTLVNQIASDLRIKENEKLLVTTLQGNSFEEGLKFLIIQAKNSRSELTFEDIKMNNERIFEVSNLDEIGEIYFKFDKKWFWSFDEDNWVEAPNLMSTNLNWFEEAGSFVMDFFGVEVEGKEIDLRKISSGISSLIKSLEGENEVKGGFLIFVHGLEKEDFSSSECSNEEVKKILTDFSWDSGESEVACSILSKAKEREGSFADTTAFCEASGEVRSCYSAVMVIYEESGIADYRDLHYRDYYSSMENEKIEGTNVLIKDETSPFVYGSKLLAEKEKLNLLKPGYQFNAVISYAGDKVGSSGWAAHSLIFVDWKDKEKNLATVFDWRGVGTTYQFTQMDLSNDKNFVYLINRFPYVASSSGNEEQEVALIEIGECSSTNRAGCQKKLGEKVYEIASSTKGAFDLKVDFSAVKEETGYKDFECLVLGVAMQESTLQMCGGKIGVGFEKEGNPFYCEKNIGTVLKSQAKNEESYGVMQLNKKYFHFDSLIYFNRNINEGSVHLLKKWVEYNFKGYEGVTGWKGAIKAYNGGGDIDYIEKVLGHREKIASMFPQCGHGGTNVPVVTIPTLTKKEKYLFALKSEFDLAFDLVRKDKSLINLQDSSGNFLLLYSSQFDDFEKVEYLLRNGARVDLKNNQGETALFYAVQTAYLKVIELLVVSGADIYSKSNYGSNILDVLEERKESSEKEEIYDYLLWRGISDEGISFKIWNIKDAIEEANNRKGDYSDNMEFIRELLISNLLNYEQVLDLKGGTLFNWEGDMEDVRKMLKKKFESLSREEREDLEEEWAQKKEIDLEKLSESIIQLKIEQMIGFVEDTTLIESKISKGTAFIIAPKTLDRLLMISAFHVIEKEDGGYVSGEFIDVNSKGDSFYVVDINKKEDVVLLGLPRPYTKEDYPQLILGDSDKIVEGEKLFFLGFPFGSEGIVKREGKVLYYQENLEIKNSFLSRVMIIDAEAEEGFSGSPVFNSKEEVIGIVIAVREEGTEVIAVPINKVKEIFLKYLEL